MENYLLIFDLDGLLVDTERLFYKAFKIICKKNDNIPSFDDYVREVILYGREIDSLINFRNEEERNIFRQEVYDKYEQLIKSELKLRKGAIECLNKLSIFDIVLVTGSKKKYCDFILERFKIGKYFTEIITRDDNFLPKPDTSIFEYVLKKYKKQPWECCVIEDSRRGIFVAQNLGIPSIFIPNEYTKNERFGLNVLKAKSLDEISPKIIQTLTEEAKPYINFTLGNLYQDSIAQLKSLFKVYNDIYDLPYFLHEDKKVIPEAFEYAKKRIYFVILIMHTRDGRVYFQRSFDTGHLSMNLPGASIHLKEEDTIITAIERLAKQSISKAKLADIAPLISLKNRFFCTDGQITEHIGFGIRALLLNDEKDIIESNKDYLFKGMFIKNFPIDEIPHEPSRKTYDVFLKWFENKNYATYINEIEAQNKFFYRYLIHQKFVNPILRLLSHFIGKNSIKKVKSEIIDRIGQIHSCIDIACGDDKSIFKLLKNINLVVANDISVDQINYMKRYYNSKSLDLPKSHSLLFTNHDCLDMPFRDNAFDVGICRNLLHHIVSAKDLENLLDNLRRVTQRIIIVEIQNPKKENIWGKMRHKYYMKFLKDEGRHFYTIQDFESVLRDNFKSKKIKFEYFPTIRGVYMIAEINTYEQKVND